MVSRALVAFLLATGFLLAGCIGAKEPVKPAAEKVNNTTVRNATLPDRPGECIGCLETNKTEAGMGGMNHTHDYWKGRETVTVFQGDVAFFVTPLLPDGQGTQPKSVAYVKLPNNTAAGGPALVYEGTDLVTVTAKAGQVCPADDVFGPGGAPVDPCTPDPNPPKVHLQYRSAADSAWRDAADLALGVPLKINVLPKETDMPHSVLSLWVFRLTTDNPSLSSVNLTIVIHKGRDVVNWPGHPDFYADAPMRAVADNKHVKTHMSGVVESQLYDQGGTWAPPDKLISYGTGKLHVIINVTNAVSQTGQAPTGYFLEVHNATVIGPEVTFGTRYFAKTNDLKHYEFDVPVDGAGMDGPYQPASRWGCRLMATFADVDLPVVGDPGLCPGCFSYDIEYDLTVQAIHTADA